MINFTFIRKTGLLVAVSLLFGVAASAQNSVFDVVPGSGPKKKDESKTVYDVTKKGTTDGNQKVYHSKRKKHLPPGQAKKIYGGSAKDYTHGHVKKRKGWYWNEANKKWYRKHKKSHKHHKHHK